MSKALRHMSDTERAAAVSRRMRQYDPKGFNGCGTLAARDYFLKKGGKVPKKKESPSDVRRREKRAKKVAA